MKPARVYPVSNRGGFAQIIIVAVILLVFVISVLLIRDMFGIRVLPVNMPVISESSKPAPSTDIVVVGETVYPDSIGANWKTYSNSKLNISFRYPVTWSVKELAGSPEYAYPGPDNTYIHLEETSTKRTISFILGSSLPTPSNVVSQKSLNLDGIPVTKTNYNGFINIDTGKLVESTKGHAGFFVGPINEKDGLFIVGKWQPDDREADKVTDQILSTFRFE